MREIPQKTIDRIEKVATKVVSKTMGRLLRKDLPQQVVMAKRMIKMTGLIDFRANLLKDRGLPSDIRDLFKKGMTVEEVKEYYWSCPEFVEFWTNTLECTEDMLDEIIRTA